VRPHVELIQEKDLVWHEAELHRGSGRARQRNLSYDEENGAASTRVVFDKAWSRPAGYHHADVEWYIKQGQVKLGARLLGKGTYLRVPAGLCIPAMQVAAGTDVLIFREYGDWGFSVSDKNRSKFVSRGGNTVSGEPGELTIVETDRMEWMPNLYEGDTQRFLKLKMLYLDPPSPEDNNTGFVSIMCWAPPGWSDNRMVHHPVFEEAYSLDGQMVYNFGTLDPGAYFFRPAKVKHGHFMAGEERGWTGIFRLDGSLINWITVNERIVIEGDAINYDPETQGAVIAGIPVRTRSAGPWDLDGQ
jgi:quercetin dioxygenase-like cupin family protein